jgi:tRNA A-37 threonylcarbamoyl transferase component Bud32
MHDSHAGSNAAPGALIGGRYRIDSLIGRGGMAAVYRAKDEFLGRSVALKLFASDGAEADALKRESSEIRVLASMNHHALVTLFDASVDGVGDAERAFLVMELVEGPTLQKRIEQGTIAAHEVAVMATDLAEALHVVHAQAVVHRDIKPANILLSPALSTGREFRAKLADFGIAYLIDSTRLTTPGTLIGTAAYLSPEQADGSAPGPAADIYSLGLVLLESLTAVRAFPGTLVESLTARLVRPPEIPGSLGYEWKSLLTAMTAMDPAARPTALDVVDVARRIGSAPSAGSAADTAAATAAATVAQTAATPMDDLLRTSPLGGEATAVQPTAVQPTAVQPAAAQPTMVQPTAAQPTRAFSTPTDAPTAVFSTATDNPTEVFAASNGGHTDPTSATERFAQAEPATATSTKPKKRAPERTPEPASERARQQRRSSLRRMIVVVVILAVLVGVALVIWMNSAGTAAPTLPALDGDLGVHLDELMESVTP